jgi:hypothetical protein
VPNIRTFETPALDIRPTEVGVEAVAAAARRGGMFSNQASDAMIRLGQQAGSAIRDAGDAAVKWQEHREISAGAAHFAQMEDSFTNGWNAKAKNADPNDPTVAATFRAGMEPSFDKFRNGFLTERGRAWAEGRIDAFREHMFHKTSADMSELAADAVHTNYNATINSSINAVYSDPSALKFKLKTLDGDIGAIIESSPNLTPAVAANVRKDLATKARENLVKSAVMGTIRNGGDWRAIADDPDNKPYINLPEMIGFERSERMYKRMAVAEEKAARIEADREARTNLNKSLRDLDLSMLNDDNELVVNKSHIAALKKIIEENPRGAELEEGKVSARMNHLDNAVKKAARAPATKDDPDVVMDLTNRLFDPDNPTTMMDLTLAKLNGKITKVSAGNIAGVVREQSKWLHDPDMKAATSGLRTIMGAGDPVGAGKYTAFIQTFLPQYMAKKRAGTLEPNALDINDPDSFISKIAAPFKRTPKQIYMDRVSHGMLAPVMTTPAEPAAATEEGVGDLVPLKNREHGKQYPTPVGWRIWDARIGKWVLPDKFVP